MQAWGLTDPGMVRSQNQDDYAIVKLGRDQLLAIVCDGMGGARSGNIASRMAVEVFSDEVRRSVRFAMKQSRIDAMLRDALELANKAVYEQSQLSEEYQGMGTTLVAALALPGESYVINVGDSRCYLIENGMIRQVTVDHSLVQLLVDRGEITVEEARRHPQKNLITRALGVESTVAFDLLRVETGQGSRLLLCSDGLSNVLPDPVLLQTSLEEREPEELCRRLVDMTLEQGAPDNVTVVLAQM